MFGEGEGGRERVAKQKLIVYKNDAEIDWWYVKAKMSWNLPWFFGETSLTFWDVLLRYKCIGLQIQQIPIQHKCTLIWILWGVFKK